MLRRIVVAALFLCVASPAMAQWLQGPWNVHAQAGIHGLVTREAATAGVPTHIAHAVIKLESGYKPHLRGRAGEWGLGQIKCQTARSVGFSGSCSQLADPSTNLRYSMRYLRLALNRGGSGCAGVSLYQSGIYGRLQCSGYGRKVMAGAR